jgi:cysteinyl-tRNA synthetase
MTTQPASLPADQLVVFNTLSGKKEPFVPVTPGHVGMYVCGITPYDLSHVGHARVYVAFDVIYRALKAFGFDVRYVRNYTDIDDKIIKRAAERGIAPEAVAGENIQAFQEDMARLNVLTPTDEPRVTTSIGDIVAMVARIVEKGSGYVVEGTGGGDVYFHVPSMADYGKLAKRSLDDMEAGARVEVDPRKKHPMDFALWKSAKPGEPSWDSPWGRGRPGWHIECSAMSDRLLGDHFDIHGGGKDLQFPHHENEIAQSEACYGHPHVKYWLHNGFVNVDNEKMSKSLGNFFTIRDVLKVYHPETLRLFLLGTHYRMPINYTEANLEDARRRMDSLMGTLQRACEYAAVKWGEVAKGVESGKTAGFDARLGENGPVAAKMTEALADDFNTPRVLAVASPVFTTLNGLVTDKADKALVVEGLRAVKVLGEVLGLWFTDPAAYLATPQGDAVAAAEKAASQGLTPEQIEALLAERTAARKAKDFKRSDAIRDELAAKGIEIKDGPTGATWRYV